MKQGPRKAGRRPLRERTRLPDEALSYAIGHYLRLEAQAVLREGEFSAGEIAEKLGEDVKLVTNHLRDLYDAGCIEFVGHKADGHHRKAVYRAVARPLINDEVYRDMSIEERHDANGVVIQWLLAECLSAYRNERMDHDENVCLMLDEPHVDAEGQEEIREFLTAVWGGNPASALEAMRCIQDIEGRAINRLSKSKESGTTMFVALLAFERGRPRDPDWAVRSSKRER